MVKRREGATVLRAFRRPFCRRSASLLLLLLLPRRSSSPASLSHFEWTVLHCLAFPSTVACHDQVQGHPPGIASRTRKGKMGKGGDLSNGNLPFRASWPFLISVEEDERVVIIFESCGCFARFFSLSLFLNSLFLGEECKVATWHAFQGADGGYGWVGWA